MTGSDLKNTRSSDVDRRPRRMIGVWQGSGELLVGGESVGPVQYSIEAHEDGAGVKSGGGVLTGADEVIARAFGQSEACLMIESGHLIPILVDEVRGRVRKAAPNLPHWQYLRSRR